MLTETETGEFEQYLRQCTDAQVRGVYNKERSANRHDYIILALRECNRRGIVDRLDMDGMA